MRPNAPLYSSENASYGANIIRTPTYKNSNYPIQNPNSLHQCQGIGPINQWSGHSGGMGVKLPPHLSTQHRFQSPMNIHPPSQNGVYNNLRHLPFQNSLPSTFPMSNGLNSCYNMHHYSNPNAMNPCILPESSSNFNGCSNSLHVNNNINQQRVNECAGIPLISNVPSHLNPAVRHRQILKKMPLNSMQVPWTSNNSTSFSSNTTHFSHLAVHAQGLPLYSNKEQQNPNNQWNPHVQAPANQKGYIQRFQPNTSSMSGAVQNEKNRSLKYQNLMAVRSKENLNEINNMSSSSNEQNNEVKDSNETSLPRIIKPRKRRKKDRKTANGMFVKMGSDFEDKAPTNTTQENVNTFEKDAPGESVNAFRNNSNLKNCLFKENLSPIDHKHNGEEIHGICFCNGCDPLRSIWDYPLKRSLSDSSGNSCSNKSSSSSSSQCKSTSSSFLSELSSYSSPEGLELDVFCSDASQNRAEIVGVIGSQRNQFESSHNVISDENKNLQRRSYDSSISCYGDILSGINIGNDLFNKCKQTLPEDNLLSSSNGSSMNITLDLLPETAETLLTESINEISRKLIETCSNDTIALHVPVASFTPIPSSASLSSFSTCSDFSNDSGIETNGSGSSSINSSSKLTCNDLIFNFESLNLLDTSNNNVYDKSNKCHKKNDKNNINDNINININNNNNESNRNASSNDLNLITKEDNFSLLGTKENNFHFKASPPPPLAALVPPLTMDFLIDMNNNKMGLSSFYENTNYITNNSIEKLPEKTSLYQDSNIHTTNTMDSVWQNESAFEETFDTNILNMSFLHNIGDNLKSTYSIT